MKAQVSRLRLGLPQDVQLPERIDAKDSFSARHFSQLHQIRFDHDSSVFDLHVDNSSHITEASIEASDLGISTFHRQLCSTLSREFGLALDKH